MKYYYVSPSTCSDARSLVVLVENRGAAYEAWWDAFSDVDSRSALDARLATFEQVIQHKRRAK